tara:strand:+ start:552 stop:1535 length:984 start_codon:yes stop_codon:yes gene_type:complete
MLLNNAAVYVCSMNNLNKRLKYYGNANMAELNLLKLIYKVASYASTDEALRRLDAMVSDLQRSSELICIDRIYGANFMPDYQDPLNIPTEIYLENPTVDDVVINVIEEFFVEENNTTEPPSMPYVSIYTFTEEDFKSTFSHIEGASANELIITSLPAEGRLWYDGSLAVANQYISDASLLDYRKNTNEEVSQSFNFIISSDAQGSAWSNEALMTINNVAVGNDPATIDDTTIYSDNNVVTVLVTSMFTEKYSDPEGDLLDAIRIDKISTSNLGVFYYDGLEITEGLVISRSDLNAGKFTHAGADVDTVSSDVIEISVRDEGSLTWTD